MAAPKAPLLDADRQGGQGAHPRGPCLGAEVKPHLVHETVRAELNARRAGTRAAKSRGLVAGGRAKPWRQKGTGRARAGTIRAPQFTGGGVAFPPTPRRLRREGQQEGAPRRAARARSRRTPRAGTLGVRRRTTCSRRPRRSSAVDAARRLGQGASRCSWSRETSEENVIKSFRNLPSACVVTVRRSSRWPSRLGALAARDRGRAASSSRGGPRHEPASERGPARAGRVGEELQPDRGPQVHVQACTRTRTRRRSGRPSRSCSSVHVRA